MNIAFDTSNIQLYDIVLMIMGSLLFIACLIIFIIQSIQTKASKTLIAFFALSIIMVGFPAITKIQVGEQFTLEKQLRKTAEIIAAGNTKPATIKEFRKTLASMEKSGSPIDDPELLTSIARAQYEIGEVAMAKTYTQQALEINSSYLPALQLQNITVQHDRKSDSLATSLERAAAPGASAADSADVKAIIGMINKESVKLSNPELLKRAASFESKTGNREEASLLLKRSKTLESIER